MIVVKVLRVLTYNAVLQTNLKEAAARDRQESRRNQVDFIAVLSQAFELATASINTISAFRTARDKSKSWTFVQ